MTVTEAITDQVMQTAKSPIKRRVQVIISIILLTIGGLCGVIWNLSGQYQAAKDHERAQDEQIVSNKEAVRKNFEGILQLSILSIHQGRYMEDVFRAVAPTGRKIPPRPSALDQIESEIFGMRLK